MREDYGKVYDSLTTPIENSSTAPGILRPAVPAKKYWLGESSISID